MRRREFIILLGGAAVAWPLMARGQQPGTPVIGVMNSQSAVPFAHMLSGFREGLRDGGFIEGQNVQIEYRWAEGHYDRLPALANDLARRGVAVLVATGGETAAFAAKATTQTIPIVFAIGGDPVKQGLVASINRPGSNVTGVTLRTDEIEGKRVGLLQAMVPKTTLVGVLINPDFPLAQNQQREVLDATSRVGLRAIVVLARSENEFQPAFAMASEQRADAFIVCADPLFNNRRDQLIALAARYRLPAIYEFREYALDGGLMSYGVNIVVLYRDVGRYTARILKGAKPSDLPIMQPTKFEFLLNLKTARTLGIEVPLGLSAGADEIIE